MDISGTVRIYKGEYEGRETYSTTVSKKDQYGNYENMYISIQLPKDVSLENNSRINVTKGFLSFYKTKQGLPKLKAVVQEFEKEETEKPQEEKASNYEQQAIDYYDNQTSYYGDDLPF